MESSTIIVKNLDKWVNETFLHNCFSFLGIIQKIEIMRDQLGNSIGSATIVFKDPTDAQNAVKYLNDTLLGNQKIEVMLEPKNSFYNGNKPKFSKHKDVYDMVSTYDSQNYDHLGRSKSIMEKYDARQGVLNANYSTNENISFDNNKHFSDATRYGDDNENVFITQQEIIKKKHYNRSDEVSKIESSDDDFDSGDNFNIETSDDDSFNQMRDIQNFDEYEDDSSFDEDNSDFEDNRQFHKKKYQRHIPGYSHHQMLQFSDVEIKNQKIFAKTEEIVEHGSYTDSKGNDYNIRKMLNDSMRNTETFDKNHDFTKDLIHQLNRQQYCKWSDKRKIYNKISVTEESTFGAARRLKEKYSNVCVLNFASATKPGGGVENGRTSQEETLSRQSNLYFSLKTQKTMYQYHNKNYNPFYTDYMIYSPNIVVFRDDDYKKIRPFQVSVISSAAVNNSEISKHSHNWKTSKDVLSCMKKRCKKILQLAMLKKNDVIVLGAFGCGVFGNKPEDISKIFRELIIDEFYGIYFTKIVFAIKGKPHQKNANFSAFEKAFKPYH